MAHPMSNAIKESLPALKQSYDVEVTKYLAIDIGSCNACKYGEGEIF